MISASDILKEYLESHALSQRQASKELGITQAHISKILSRELFMSVKLARKIELVYGLPARTLLVLDMEYKLKQLEERIVKTFNIYTLKKSIKTWFLAIFFSKNTLE